MIDRCAGCGWPIYQHRACCSRAYWSLREPLPQDSWWPLIRCRGYYLYGLDPQNELWRPDFPKPRGYHYGYPPLVMEVYKAYLLDAKRRRGQLIHRRELIESYLWARNEVRHRRLRAQPD